MKGQFSVIGGLAFPFSFNGRGSGKMVSNEGEMKTRGDVSGSLSVHVAGAGS